MSLGIYDQGVFKQVAHTLRIGDPNWLIDMVNFESGFNPKAKNPFSSARGLIQFMDATARDMGYESSLDLVTKYPTLEDQLQGPVIDYLRRYAPFETESDLYMAVFYPAARNYPGGTSFADIFKDRDPQGWKKKYDRFIKANPGILSPNHYVGYVKKSH